MTTTLVALLALSLSGIILAVILSRTTKPLLEMVLTLQKRVERLELQPTFYSQTVDGLNNRNEYLQKKNDELQYELRVIHGNRDALLARTKILEEQNQMLTDTLRILKS